MRTIETKQKYLGNVKLPDPEFGDIKLNVFPIKHNGEWIKLTRQCMNTTTYLKRSKR